VALSLSNIVSESFWFIAVHAHISIVTHQALASPATIVTDSV
jgi:hypothetical protein